MSHPAAEHVAAFCRTEDFLREQVADFVGHGLLSGEQVIVIATSPHIDELGAQLNADGISFERAVEEGRLLLLDAHHILAGLIRNRTVSADAFRAILGRFIDPRIKQRVYGEFVSLVAHRGDLDTALAIESMGHELAHRLHIPVLCGYEASGARALTDDAVARIQAVHDRSLLEGPSVLSPPKG